jgi:hypothetical protein
VALSLLADIETLLEKGQKKKASIPRRYRVSRNRSSCLPGDPVALWLLLISRMSLLLRLLLQLCLRFLVLLKPLRHLCAKRRPRIR